MKQSETICDDCGGLLNKVGLFGCNKKHPKPNFAQRIVRAIEDDLNDRRGMKLSQLDDDVAYEIKGKWEKIITKLLRKRDREDKSHDAT